MCTQCEQHALLNVLALKRAKCTAKAAKDIRVHLPLHVAALSPCGRFIVSHWSPVLTENCRLKGTAIVVGI